MKYLKQLPPLQELSNVFLAVVLPEQAQKEFQTFLDEIATFGADIKYQPAASAHITLHFWESIDQSIFEEIQHYVERLQNQFEPFDVTLNKLKYFPNPRRPFVTWLDVRSNKRINEMALLRPWDDKRSFTPHCTLGRIQTIHTFSENRKKIEDIARDTSIDFKATTLKLYARYAGVSQQAFIEWEL